MNITQAGPTDWGGMRGPPGPKGLVPAGDNVLTAAGRDGLPDMRNLENQYV